MKAVGRIRWKLEGTPKPTSVASPSVTQLNVKFSESSVQRNEITAITIASGKIAFARALMSSVDSFREDRTRGPG
jgi:hypothetical protein